MQKVYFTLLFLPILFFCKERTTSLQEEASAPSFFYPDAALPHLTLGSGPVPTRRTCPPPTGTLTDDAIRTYMRDLGSDTFQTREHADLCLRENFCERVRELLAPEVSQAGLEVRRRMEKILRDLEPTLVRGAQMRCQVQYREFPQFGGEGKLNSRFSFCHPGKLHEIDEALMRSLLERSALHSRYHSGYEMVRSALSGRGALKDEDQSYRIETWKCEQVRETCSLGIIDYDFAPTTCTTSCYCGDQANLTRPTTSYPIRFERVWNPFPLGELPRYELFPLCRATCGIMGKLPVAQPDLERISIPLRCEKAPPATDWRDHKFATRITVGGEKRPLEIRINFPTAPPEQIDLFMSTSMAPIYFGERPIRAEAFAGEKVEMSGETLREFQLVPDARAVAFQVEGGRAEFVMPDSPVVFMLNPRASL